MPRDTVAEDKIIALAWPDTVVVAAPGLYDRIFSILSINRSGYYKAGHAAMVLVDGQTGELSYYDFGRYITPNGFGRVRGKNTDPELNFLPKAKLENGAIRNLDEVLDRLQRASKLTHGDGVMYASVADQIDGKGVRSMIDRMQIYGGQPYGPFHFGGTNCSRFVMDAILRHGKGRFRMIRGKLSMTPSPLGVVKKGTQRARAYRVEKGEIISFRPWTMNLWKMVVGRILESIEAPQQLSAPILPPSQYAQWLTGIGAGAWHEVTQPDWLAPEMVRFRRWSIDQLDFDKVVHIKNTDFQISEPFNIDYYSTARVLRVSQNGQQMVLEVVGDFPSNTELHQTVNTGGIDEEYIS